MGGKLGMEKLTPLSKVLIAAILIGSSVAAVRTHGARFQAWSTATTASPSASAEPAPSGQPQLRAQAKQAADKPGEKKAIKVALSQWPGHMALLVGAGGLKTEAGSIAAREGLDLEIVFIEDAPSKNKALQTGEVDAVWQTVDELPISLGGYRSAGIGVRAFLQIDWSRGGDACVASYDVQKVEDVLGRGSAMLMFSPDHTVFEFMITNSRLTPEQVTAVRRATKFSMDDFTFGRKLFAEKKVDVACLWEPDVTLALSSRPGAHRLFSTADATELVADVLLARQDFLQENVELAKKLARVWFKAVEKANSDPAAAARLISTAASRFRDELGYEPTLKALDWAKWTSLADNVRFFGLDGSAPAFDRVYNQADSIWINYPQAEIKDRFAPATVRDDRVARALWEESGKPVAASDKSYDPALARAGAPLFTKPVSINFPTAGSELSTEAISVINREILPQLEIAKSMSIRVEGNTDSIGEPAQNQALSERRAGAIVDYLAKRGIPLARMVAQGNGQSLPVASNKTVEGRALNRRTDIVFIRSSKK
jgi:outer membrane protein OmpA-like peptidoglycan-associated protein/ABC-type nitrate/sulfonate/bicarbonate transport system substrate-binding protein